MSRDLMSNWSESFEKKLRSSKSFNLCGFMKNRHSLKKFYNFINDYINLRQRDAEFFDAKYSYTTYN